MDGMGFEFGADAAREVEEGEDRGVGMIPGDRCENLLAATHAGEPVVDQCNALSHGVGRGTAWGPDGASAGECLTCERRYCGLRT